MFLLSVENTIAALVTYESTCEDLSGARRNSALPSIDLTHKVTLALFWFWSLEFHTLQRHELVFLSLNSCIFDIIMIVYALLY